MTKNFTIDPTTLTEPSEEVRAYLAGKVAKSDWRHQLVDGLGKANRHDPVGWDRPGHVPTGRGFTYTGPHFVRCDHGCAHGDNRHGIALADGSGCFEEERNSYGDPAVYLPTVEARRRSAYNHCLDGIRSADLVFAWLGGESASTAYGTLVELGYAKALGKSVWIGVDADTPDDLWFSQQTGKVIVATDPVAAFTYALRQEQRSRARSNEPAKGFTS